MDILRASSYGLCTLLLWIIPIFPVAPQTASEQVVATDQFSGTPSEMRALFLPDNLKQFADTDLFIPVPQGGAIPTLRFIETCAELLSIDNEKEVLVIGRSTGYTVAVLAEQAKTVYAAEMTPGLSETYAEIRQNLGIENVVPVVYPNFLMEGNLEGFDAIVVHGVTEKITALITGMILPGGGILAPLVDTEGVQEMVRLLRKTEGWELSATGLSFFPTVPLEID